MTLKSDFKWKILFYKISFSCEVAASIGFLRHAALSERRRRKKIPNERFSILIQQAAEFFCSFHLRHTVLFSSTPRHLPEYARAHSLSPPKSHLSLSLPHSLHFTWHTVFLTCQVLSFFALLPVSSFSFSPHSLPFLDRQFPGKEEESGVNVTALFVAQCYARFLPPPPPSPSSLSPFP